MIAPVKIDGLFHGSPNPVWLSGNDGDCLYGNLALKQLTGLNSGQLKRLDWRSFLLDEDRALATVCWKQSVSIGAPYHSRVRIRKSDGVGIPIDLQAFRHRLNSEGDVWVFSGLQLENAAAEQPLEWQMQSTLNLIPAHTWYTLPSGALTFVNKRCADYLGLPADSPFRTGVHVQAAWDCHIPLLHPDDREETRKVWANCLSTGCPGDVSFRVRDAAGEYRWFLSRAEPLRADGGRVLYWVGINLEIEELKQAEFYLAESQRLSHTGAWAFHSSGFEYWSSELFRIHGLDRGTKAPNMEEYLSIVHPEDRDFVVREIQKMFANDSDFDFTKRIARPDGEVRHVRYVGAPSRGSISRSFVGTGIDVTEQVSLTEELRRREAYLAEAQRLSHTGSFGWNVSRDEHFWSDETFRIFELPPTSKVSLQTVLDFVHPQDMSLVNMAIAAARNAEGVDLEFRLVMPDGRIKHLHAVGNAQKDKGGSVELIGAVTDITARKLTEVELRRGRAHLADAQRLSRTGCVGMEKNTKRIFWSDEAARIYGYPAGTEPTPELILARSHPDDLSLVKDALERAVQGKSDFDYEHRLVMPDGSIKHLHDLAHCVRDDAGNEEIVGAIMDVTESRTVEAEIRRREAELRQMLDFTPHLVAVFGGDRERRYANRAALEYLGMSLEEWRQGAFGSQVHPEDIALQKASWERTSQTGQASEYEVRVRAANGDFRWFLARISPVHDERKQVNTWYISCTDIDDRKRNEDRLRQENLALREEVDQALMFEEIVGNSSALGTVLSRVAKVASSDATVLISGETGTGKELVARAIHRRSPRSSRPFVSVNCSAIPRDLILSELFGHEKGAFTGAMQRRIGRFELADGGTLFLDEVGELPLEIQVALLRVLQEREFERVGGGPAIRVNVRVISATNRDLQSAVANGTFRQDLFYRLNVFPIVTPPLRERKDDILVLVEYFLQRYAAKAGKRIRSIEKKTLDALQAYNWPGNIRELQNVIERSVILTPGDVLSVDEMWLSRETVAGRHPVHGENLSEATESRTEREVIERALTETRGRVSGPAGAAVKLGIPSSTLATRIRALKIDRLRFKFR